MEVQKFSGSDVVFPASSEINNDEQDKAWIKTTSSQIKLPAESLNGDKKSYTFDRMNKLAILNSNLS